MRRVFPFLCLVLLVSACTNDPGGHTAILPEAPGAPTQVAAIAGNGSATVSWTAPQKEGTSSITGYEVTSIPGNKVTASTSTQVVIAGLTNGAAYTFTVHALNAVGTGPESLPSSPVIPVAAAVTPASPTGVVATAGDASASVRWTAPASDGGSAITRYTVTTTPGGIMVTTSDTSVTVPGLANGTPYVFTVHATNAVGDGPESLPSVPITPMAAQAAVPAAPTNVTAERGNASATVTWMAPEMTGSAPISGYTITAHPGGLTVNVTVTMGTVSGLTNGTAYTFTVHATNSYGSSPESASSGAVVPSTTPGAPRNVIAVAGDGVAVLTWDAPADNGGSSVTGYAVSLNDGSGLITTVERSLQLAGLTNGFAYVATVSATNIAGTGPAASSNSFTPTIRLSAPGAPTSVTAVRGNASASISWTAPTDTGNSPILGYVVTASPGGATSTTTGTSARVTGLTNGVTYAFTVHAWNSIGVGPESAPSSPITPATVPTAPLNVIVTAGDRSATASWSPPTSNGGSPVTLYLVTVSPGGATVSAADTHVAITGLTNGQSYVLQVEAINDVGLGPASNVSNTFVPLAVPGAPRDVIVTPGNSSAALTWSAPVSDGGTPIISYKISVFPGTRTVTTSDRSALLYGLANNTTYGITIHATNAVGDGPESDLAVAIPASDAGQPIGLHLLQSPDSASNSAIAPLPCNDWVTASSFIVYTDAIRDLQGNIVPDGTMITFKNDETAGQPETLVASGDADSSTPGIQRATRDGVAIARISAPSQTTCLTVDANTSHLLAGVRTVSVTASAPNLTDGRLPIYFAVPTGATHVNYVAEDFSSTADEDVANTTAQWDTTTGTAMVRPNYSLGTCADGDFPGSLTLPAGRFDLQASTNLMKASEVSALNGKSATVSGTIDYLQPGDEVMLFTIWGPSTSSGPGAYEFHHVASVDTGSGNGVIRFAEPIVRTFGNGTNSVLTGHRVVVQRVPQFRNVTVPSNVVLTATEMTAVNGVPTGGTGMLAFRACGDLVIESGISMQLRGFPQGLSSYPVVTSGNGTSRLLSGPPSSSGSGSSTDGGGVIFVNARTVSFTQSNGWLSADGISGGAGMVWLAGPFINFAAGTRLFARGGTTGITRIDTPAPDWALSNPNPAPMSSTLTTYAQNSGDVGPKTARTKGLYALPPSSGLLARQATLTGLLGGAGEVAPIFGHAPGGTRLIPGFSLSITSEGGLSNPTWYPFDSGTASIQGLSGDVRLNLTFVPTSDQPVMVRAVAFAVTVN